MKRKLTPEQKEALKAKLKEKYKNNDEDWTAGTLIKKSKAEE